MFAWISKTWNLFKMSLGILWSNKRLFFFPVACGIALIIVWVACLAPLWLIPGLQDWLWGRNNLHGLNEKLRMAALAGGPFVFLFLQYLLIIFFNSALISCVMATFRGERPSLRRGLTIALSRLPQIAGWAIVTATVITLLRAINQQMGGMGRIAAQGGEITWSVAAMIGVPVLVVEGLGPVAALRRSTEIFKQKWGESLIVSVSLSALNSLLVCLALVLGTFGSIAAGIYFNSAAGAFIPLGAILVFAGLLWVVENAVMQIFAACIYFYATEGRVPNGASEEFMATAVHATK